MRAGCRNSEGRERGFILVAVLFLTTLLLGAATTFAVFARNEMRRVSDEEYALKARSLASVTAASVSRWIAADDNEYDSARELLYNPAFPKVLKYGEWMVAIRIIPQNGLLHINSIFLPDGITIRKEYEYPWSEIWGLLNKSETARLVLDFLDRDTNARVGSSEEEYFPNRNISDLSELLHLPDIDRKLLFGDRASDISLSRFFTVYGSETININIAPQELIALLDSDIGTERAKSIVQYRSKANIKNHEDLMKIPGFPKAVITRTRGIIGYNSTYFMVRLKVQGNKKERNFVIMMKRSSGKCEIVNWRE